MVARQNGLPHHWNSLSQIGGVDGDTGVELSRFPEAARFEEADESLAKVFDLLPDSALIVDRDMRVLLANGAACRLLDTVLEDMVGKRCSEIIYGTQRLLPGCPVHRCLKDGKSAELVCKGRAAGNRWLRVVATPVEIRGEKAALCVLKDVTSALKRQRHLDHIEKLSMVLSRDLDLNTILQTALAEIKGIFDDQASVIGVALCDETCDNLVVTSVSGRQGEAVAGLSLNAQSLKEGVLEPLSRRSTPWVLKRNDDRSPSALSEVLQRVDCGCLLAWPLEISGRAIGILFAAGEETLLSGDAEIRLLGTCCRMLSSALANGGAFALNDAVVHRLADELDFLTRLLTDHVQGRFGDPWGNEMVGVARVLGASEVTLYAFDRSGRWAEVVAAYSTSLGADGPPPRVGERVPLSGPEALVGCGNRGRIVDGRRLVIPLVCGGRVLGAMELWATAEESFAPVEKNLAQAVACHFALVMERQQSSDSSRDISLGH